MEKFVINLLQNVPEYYNCILTRKNSISASITVYAVMSAASSQVYAGDMG
jgi:hypothetical protein